MGLRTSSTSFSRKGTSFRSSLSFLSTNQLSMGIPLESWANTHIQTVTPLKHRAATEGFTLLMEELYLVGKGLGWVVDYYRLGEIPSQDVEVFDVVPLNTHAVLAKQPVPETTHTQQEVSSDTLSDGDPWVSLHTLRSKFKVFCLMHLFLTVT